VGMNAAEQQEHLDKIAETHRLVCIAKAELEEATITRKLRKETHDDLQGRLLKLVGELVDPEALPLFKQEQTEEEESEDPTVPGWWKQYEAGITPGWKGKSIVELAHEVRGNDDDQDEVWLERFGEMVREALELPIEKEPTVGHVLGWMKEHGRDLDGLISPMPTGELLVLGSAMRACWKADPEMQLQVDPELIGHYPEADEPAETEPEPPPVEEVLKPKRRSSRKAEAAAAPAP
jgi:hypothetical protein